MSACRCQPRVRLPWLTFLVLLLFWCGISSSDAEAARCATGLRSANPAAFTPLRPLARRAAARIIAPIPTTGANVLATEHFRVLWGNNYNRFDPDWLDDNGDGIPLWVEVLAAAMEEAYASLEQHGFPEPYGVENFFLDVYVGNTGIVAEGYSVTIPAGYYAYTEIDPDYDVAYFVFNNDFSTFTGHELEVLRVVAAHELFHAVQRVDYPWDDEIAVPDSRWYRELWWIEATATWMEEIIHPEVNDYASFVREFLAFPEDSITLADGEREYGAAIFPGYLWLLHGGAARWREIFNRAFELGVEGAIETALAEGDEPPLAEVVTAFWSAAAHPEDTWPDGLLYRSNFAPRLFQPAEALPYEFSPAFTLAPDRFGANLFRLPAGDFLEAGISQTAPGTRWKLGISTATDPIPVVLDIMGGQENLRYATDGSAPLYIALVNVSGTEGYQSYRSLLDIGFSPAGDDNDTAPDNGTGDSGDDNETDPADNTGDSGGDNETGPAGNTWENSEDAAAIPPAAAGSDSGCFIGSAAARDPIPGNKNNSAFSASAVKELFFPSLSRLMISQKVEDSRQDGKSEVTSQ